MTNNVHQRYLQHSSLPPARMPSDAQCDTPFKANFQLTLLSQTDSNHIADEWECCYIATMTHGVRGAITSPNKTRSTLGGSGFCANLVFSSFLHPCLYSRSMRHFSLNNVPCCLADCLPKCLLLFIHRCPREAAVMNDLVSTYIYQIFRH